MSMGLYPQRYAGMKINFSLFSSPSILKSSEGEMDGCFGMAHNNEILALGVWENKGTESSPTCAQRQAGFAYGYNIAMGHLEIGIEAEDVLVPIVICTGNLIQFGAVYTLEPSFPVYTNISKVFDLNDDDDAKQAAAFLIRAKAHIETTKAKVKELLKTKSEPFLVGMQIQLNACSFTNNDGGQQQKNNECQYYLKLYQEADAKTKGLNSFSGLAEHGCKHMIRIFNTLQKTMSPTELKSVVFPRALRTADKSTKQKDAMIFDNLCWKNIEGGPFKCGLPDRFAGNGEANWNWILILGL